MIENGEIYVQTLTSAGTPDSGILPYQFLELLPKNCPSCGTPTIITSTLTQLYCPSEDCGGKSVKRLLQLTKDLGVKDFGESRIRKFFARFGMSNPYAIFAYDPTDGDGEIGEGVSMDLSMKIYEQFNSRKTMQLWEYVKIGNFKGLRDRALHLFGDYDDLNKFYEDFEQGGVGFVQSRLNIEGANQLGVSVVAVELANTLQNNKSNLLKFIEYVDIIKLTQEETFNTDGTVSENSQGAKRTFNICMSTAVGAPYKSKEDFSFQMKDTFKDNFVINVIGGVSDFCDVLIWAGGVETTKVRTAKSKNAKRQKLRQTGEETKPDILILSGAEFRNYLQDIMERG